MAKLIAHQVLAIGLSLYMLKPNSIIDTLTSTFLTLIGSIVPDFDLKLKHRALLHSLFAAILTSMAVYVILNMVVIKPIYHTTSYIIGYVSHIIVDILTYNGVALLYPIHRKRYRILKINYDNPIYNGLLILLGTLLLYLYFSL